jgi:hypothetical protein
MKDDRDIGGRGALVSSKVSSKANSKARLKREPPRRGGPVRNVTMAFRSPEPAAAESRAPAPGPAEAPRGVVEQAVATAYRVFEEYMQRGRQAALRQHQTEETGGPMRQQDPATMAMQYWTNMAQTWFGAMAPFMSWGMPGMPGAARGWEQGGPMAGQPFPGTAAAGHRLALAVEVTSPHPTEVRVSLHDHKSALKPLRVQDLETDGGEKLPSSAVQFEVAGDHLRVRVHVPDATPPGVYSGPIIDKERSGVGKLEVVIHRRT